MEKQDKLLHECFDMPFTILKDIALNIQKLNGDIKDIIEIVKRESISQDESENKRYCTKCKKSYIYWEDHMRRKHMKDVYSCLLHKRKRYFYTEQEYDQHVQQHKEEIACEMCKKGFYTQDGYNQHMVRIHKKRKVNQPDQRVIATAQIQSIDTQVVEQFQTDEELVDSFFELT
jgi:hypothetical protein